VKQACDLIPWKVTDISFRPHRNFWSMNPSIHHDGETWRCVIRCCDYCMRGGVTVRSRKSRGGARTKNAMVILDPTDWRPVEIYKMRECDAFPRSLGDNVGFEDVRIFQTDVGGLQGISASQHLRRSHRHRPLPEQVLLSFDAAYNIIEARPLRGNAWDALAQKNWAPFDRSTEPRFLYSIGGGLLFDDHGALNEEAHVRPSMRVEVLPHVPDEGALRRARERANECEVERRKRVERAEHLSFGRIDLTPDHAKLRGGTQLVHVGDESWLGIGHTMKLVRERKYYYHTWYLVDGRGKMRAASPLMKFAPNGIEFAAGLAIHGDRVVVSFGVDDFECKIGETSLSAVLEILRPL
jgi:hypothetical protein